MAGAGSVRRGDGRRRLWSLLVAGALALGLAAAPGRPTGAEPMELDAENLLRLAILMIDQGRPREALGMAEALLARDPEDSGVLALKSRAERDLGLNDAAVGSARGAWTSADNAGQRYDAAMAMAQGLASDGQKFRAQFWLRRAMQAAPDPAAKKVAERDFAYVRTRSRLWLRFDASIRPSNNVNNGSSSDILWFYGLPLVLSGDAQALSGTEGTFGASLRYRLAETEVAKTDLTVSALGRRVALSGEAKAQAPGARGSDYAYTALEVGLDRTWRPAGLPGAEARATLTLGHDWYAGDPMSNYLRLETSLSKPVTPKLAFSGSLALERQDRLDSAIRSADIWTLGFGMTTLTGAKDRIGLGLSFRDTASDSPEIDHQRLRLDLDWTRREPVMGARLALGLWAEMKDYSLSRYSPDGRLDEGVGAELSLAFEKVDYMGFIPVVTLSGSRTRSNISLYDSQSLGVGFSIRSKF